MDGTSATTKVSLGTQDPTALSSTAVQRPTRIGSLDVLRGVGVLGMLAVHIQLFAFPIQTFAFPNLARWNPTAYGDLEGLNWWVWLATSLLADGKFIAIFAMLLGASIVMPRGDVSDHAPAWLVHVRRMAALLVLGLLHAYLLWYGDMLVPLALSGAVVFLARPISNRWLLILGGLALATASALSFGLTWSAARSDPAALAVWREQWTPRSSTIGPEIVWYQGGWVEQMQHRVPAAWETQTWSFVTPTLLADDGSHADGHGAVQAGSPQRRPVPRFLQGSGNAGVRHRYSVERPRALAEPRDEVGPSGFRAGQPTIALLGQSHGGSGLDGSRDAALPARLAASSDRGRGTNGPDPTTCVRR